MPTRHTSSENSVRLENRRISPKSSASNLADGSLTRSRSAAIKSSRAVDFIVGCFHFEEPVGKEHDKIVHRNRTLAGPVLGFIKQAKWRSSAAVGAYRLKLAPECDAAAAALGGLHSHRELASARHPRRGKNR